MRVVYGWIAPLHDPATRYLLPLVQGSSEASTRDGSMRRLGLGELTSAEGRPPKVLEVGVGSGGNLPWVERDLPRGLDVELWGVDLSPEMLALCRRRLARADARPVRLALADGHALPFPDASFDRVYNVGGIGTYRDPRRALAEMARVARPGTPIVVVDEQLDPHADNGLFHRLAFRALTAYDPWVRCPVDALPPNAVDVIEEQVSRFYYCLTFRTRAPARAAP
jgi:ubiquinone/menaquinone biosynthesis C-methylase UbiE